MNGRHPTAVEGGDGQAVPIWEPRGAARGHLSAFVQAYNHAKRLKTLRGLTPYEFVCREWQRELELFYRDPTQDTLGPYT